MAMCKVYGIPNCDTIKKTLAWLTAHGISFEFHNYKKSDITKDKLAEWCRQAGWEQILNKKSSTWRGLPLLVQEKITNENQAIQLMTEYFSIIKRPVVETDRQLLIGFSELIFSKQLKDK